MFRLPRGNISCHASLASADPKKVRTTRNFQFKIRIFVLKIPRLHSFFRASALGASFLISSKRNMEKKIRLKGPPTLRAIAVPLRRPLKQKRRAREPKIKECRRTEPTNNIRIYFRFREQSELILDQRT